MADALKEMFNEKFYTKFSLEFKKADKNFNSEKFLKDVLNGIDELSLNERLRKTSIVLKSHLPSDFKKSVDILYKVIPNLDRGYTSLVFPDYIGLFGHQNFKLSMEALKYFTEFGSSEFAIREFLKRDFYKTLAVMEKWADDKNYHVRRLASEGSRARLPWSFKLDEVIKNPSSTKNILEKLKSDPELYVKKSVANHLNDLSKDNPSYMIAVIKKWDSKNLHTAWIIKHASRTLIKKGDVAALSVFSFEKNVNILIENFKIDKPKIKIGETLKFSFDIISKKNSTQMLVVDYGIHYQKKVNLPSKKVFKLKELELKGYEKIAIVKSQLFKDFSTRKHYSGKHKVEIMVNGKVYAEKEFILYL